MVELELPDENTPLWEFRVGVDFLVSARDVVETRALVDRALSAEDADGTAFVTRGRRVVEDGLPWGVSDWKAVPPRPSQAALVQDKYPGLVAELAVIEGLGAMLGSEAASRLPEETVQRMRAMLAEADSEIVVEEPEDAWGRRVFEGVASDAARHLAEGVYQAFDADDREYALVVAPSELTPSGRVSAAFPRQRHESRALDEISRLLQQHTCEQSLPELVRLISRRVNTTRRAGFPSWVPLEGEPESTPLPARAYVGVIIWSDLDGQDPTVIADASATAMARRLATVLHETLSDRDAFAGATEFLETHRSPDEWKGPEDVGAWLDDLRAATPYPAFWYEQIEIGNTPAPPLTSESPAPATERSAAPEGTLWTYQVPVEFEVSAPSPSEARRLVDEALIGDAAPATPAAVQQRQQVRPDGDIYGVLGWHHPAQPLTGAADPIRDALGQRAGDITPDGGGERSGRIPGLGRAELGL
jgi:hypothetical protein